MNTKIQTQTSSDELKLQYGYETLQSEDIICYIKI